MKYFVPEKEVLVAATGVQGTMAYAGVAQANEDGKGMQVYSGRRIPFVYWDTSGEDYRRLRLSSRPIPIPGNTDHGPSCRCSLKQSTLINLMANQTYDLPPNLGDLMGAYDEAHWQTAVLEIKAGIGVLQRGTILASGTAGDIGKLVLLSPTTEAQGLRRLIGRSG